jgi:hypothetical protein
MSRKRRKIEVRAMKMITATLMLGLQGFEEGFAYISK